MKILRIEKIRIYAVHPLYRRQWERCAVSGAMDPKYRRWIWGSLINGDRSRSRSFITIPFCRIV